MFWRLCRGEEGPWGGRRWRVCVCGISILYCAQCWPDRAPALLQGWRIRSPSSGWSVRVDGPPVARHFPIRRHRSQSELSAACTGCPGDLPVVCWRSGPWPRMKPSSLCGISSQLSTMFMPPPQLNPHPSISHSPTFLLTHATLRAG